MAGRPLVVLTGAEGKIGTGFREEYLSRFHAAYELRLAVRPPDFMDDRFQDVRSFDVERLDDVRGVLRGADAVIHLAANADWQAPWEELVGPNVIGTWNVFEAARLEGVRRVVYASSVHAVMALPVEVQARDHDVRPDTAYGATKVFGEALCSVFSHQHDLSCIAVRIGGYVAPEGLRELRASANPQQLDIVVTQRDLAQLLHLAIVASEDVRHAVVGGLSGNRYRRLDLRGAEELLGYRPEDDAFDISRRVELGPEEQV